MKITKENIKETLRSIMKEESEYQTFFKKALEKAGKSIPSMSDEEKKAFFNKIDAAWNAKGEKNEELVGNQHKLDIDGDGEIEASDLAALRAGEKKDESVNESINEAVSKTYKIPTQRGTLHIEVEEDPAGVFVDVIFNRVDLTTTDIQFPTGEVKVTQRQKRVKLKESVNEGKKRFNQKNNVGSSKYVISYHDGQKKHKDGSDFFDIQIFKNQKDLETFKKVLLSKGFIEESINEEIKVGQMVKVVNNPHWEAALGKKGPFKRKVKGIYGDSVFFTDGSNSDMKYVKEGVESVDEYNVNKKFGSKYDIGAGSMGNGTTFWNRAEEEFGDYKTIAHVSNNGAVKFYDKTLPSNVKKHIEDYAKTQKESVNEGRGFVAAAKKAKEEGKTEFEYKGKKYPVTIK